METKKEYITKSGLIGKRGWTKSMVEKLLKNTEYKTAKNPYYKSASPMILYCLEDIEKIEKTKEFQEAKEKACKRQSSAKKAVKTKITKTMNLAKKFSVKVERIGIKKLEKLTLTDKQYWYDNQLYYGGISDVYSAPEDTKRRWMVNYIRHNLSDYDYELLELQNRTGKDKGYMHYRAKLAEEMKKVYPELAADIDIYMSNDRESMEEEKCI